MLVFAGFAVLMLISIILAFRQTGVRKIYPVIVLVYLGVFSLLVLSGAVKNYPLPLAPLLFLSVAALSVWLAFSTFGKRASEIFSFSMLLGYQAFRLPLEIILHHWAQVGTIPATMTWTGQNWDVVTGIVSLFCFPFLNKNLKLAWAVQILGFVLLLNVLRVALFSMPLPFAWPLENPLQLIFYFPYALIGPLFVGPALCIHLIVFRKLLRLPSIG